MYRHLYQQFLAENVTNKECSPSGFVSVRCPFHDDKKPSAGFKPDTGWFNCQAGCGLMSPEEFVARVTNTTLEKGREIVEQYRREHGLIEHHDTFVLNRASNPRFDKLAETARENLCQDYELVQWYLQSRGLKYETLVECGIGFLPAEFTSWNRDSLVYPYYYDGECVGIRYRDADGHKGGEPGCHFCVWGVDELDNASIAVVTEGESDRLRTYQVCKNRGIDIAVVSTPTATFRREWAREFAGLQKVIILPQSDEASESMVARAVAALGDKATVVRLPWARKQTGKDVCDWLKYHSEDELWSLIQTGIGDITRHILTGREFEAVASGPRHWLINGLLARRQIGVIGGPPKALKTWLSLNLIRTLITGEDFCGIPGMYSEGGAKSLIVEEEGDIEELYQRAVKVFDGLDNWKDFTFWAHHLHVRLDEDVWIDRLINFVTENDIDLILLDPFQRLHSKDENSASEIGLVWERIHRVTTQVPTVSIILVHHYNKIGSIEDGWAALRGSIRTAAECDLGILVERGDGNGTLNVRIDGRSIPEVLGADGTRTIRLAFDPATGRLEYDRSRVTVAKWSQLVQEIKERGGIWAIADAAAHFKVSQKTIKAWAAKSQVPIEETKPAPGQPACFKIAL